MTLRRSARFAGRAGGSRLGWRSLCVNIGQGFDQCVRVGSAAQEAIQGRLTIFLGQSRQASGQTLERRGNLLQLAIEGPADDQAP